MEFICSINNSCYKNDFFYGFLSSLQRLYNKYNIHRTRKGFPNNGIDSFENMAAKGTAIINKVVLRKMEGFVDKQNNRWVLPIRTYIKD